MRRLSARRQQPARPPSSAFWRGLKRSVLEYVSIEPQPKRSQNPKSASVPTSQDIGDVGVYTARMVHGGKVRWARLLALSSWGGVLGLGGTAGCGGRTSMLDPEAYAFSSGGDGGGAAIGVAGKTMGGGSSIIGKGGAATSPGKGSASNVDPSLSVAPCQRYCPSYGTQCAARLHGQDCFDACQGEVNGSGSACQALGINSLRCLTPFFTIGGGNCDVAVNNALASCGMVVDAFEKCKMGGKPAPAMPAPVPTPAPMPMPAPPPVVDVTTCASMGGDGGSMSCKQAFQCPDGFYETTCSLPPQMAGLAVCTCFRPDGQVVNVSLQPHGKPCWEAAAFCN
jgi:hypothetical protein